MGTKTKMNIGQYVFEQIVKHAKIDDVKCPIAFPTLLCGIILEQHPSLISVADIPKKRESPLTLHPKMFSADHVPDLVGTSKSTHAAKPMTKEEIIITLKNSCVILDERKAQFELMIYALEKEDVIAEEELEESEDEEDDNADKDHEDEEALGSCS